MKEKPGVCYLDSSTGGWAKLDDKSQQRLTQPLIAHNLIVLAGLGTSLCIDGAPKMSDLWSKVTSGRDVKALLKKLTAEHIEKSQDVEELLSTAHQHHQVTRDSELKTFVDEAEKCIATACDFVKEESTLDAHVLFLQKIARRPRDRARTRVFTTNYDLAFESAASRAAFVVIDGFDFGSTRTFDPNYFDYDIVRVSTPAGRTELIPNVFVLHKLHGSISWEAVNGRVHNRVRRADRPAMIYPRASKFELSFRQPFFDSASRLHSALRQPETTLLIVGSGLRDSHIAGPILSSLRTNSELSVILVAPSLQADCQDQDRPHKVLADLAGAGDGRVVLVEANFEQLAEVLPDLAPPSDDDKYRRMIEQIPEDRWHSHTTPSTPGD